MDALNILIGFRGILFIFLVQVNSNPAVIFKTKAENIFKLKCVDIQNGNGVCLLQRSMLFYALCDTVKKNFQGKFLCTYPLYTGNKNNQDVYIKYSYRKENGKTSSHIYRKSGKFNDLLEQFSGDKDKLIDGTKNQAVKETELYKQWNEKIAVDFSLRLAKICQTIKECHKFKYDFNAILTHLITKSSILQ